MYAQHLENVVVLIYAIIFIFILTKYTSKASYKYDKDGRYIYYPNGFKKGYVINDKSIIDNIYKSYWKCFVFNIKGFYDDIDNLFKDCEVVNEILPFKTRMTNLAMIYPWFVLLFIFVSSCLLAIYFYITNIPFIALIFLPMIFIYFMQIIIKIKNNK